MRTEQKHTATGWGGTSQIHPRGFCNRKRRHKCKPKVTVTTAHAPCTCEGPLQDNTPPSCSSLLAPSWTQAPWLAALLASVSGPLSQLPLAAPFRASPPAISSRALSPAAFLAFPVPSTVRFTGLKCRLNTCQRSTSSSGISRLNAVLQTCSGCTFSSLSFLARSLSLSCCCRFASCSASCKQMPTCAQSVSGNTQGFHMFQQNQDAPFEDRTSQRKHVALVPPEAQHKVGPQDKAFTSGVTLPVVCGALSGLTLNSS